MLTAPPGYHSPARVSLSAALIALVGLLTLVPIGFAVVGSFNAAQPGMAWTWGFDAWIDAFQSQRSLSAIVYSFLLTLRIPIALVIGFVLAWLLVRVEIPGKGFIEFFLWIAYFLPSLPVAVGWVLLLHKDYGLVNQALMLLPFIDHPIFDVHSVSGIIWVHLTLTTIPIMMILIGPALRQLDANLEQSAKVCGSGSVRTLRRILVPILAPALLTCLLAGYIRGLEAFEIELLLGTPADIFVFPTRIYDLIFREPPLFPQAMALSTALLAFLFLLTVLYQVYAGRVRHATISGRGVSFVPLHVGSWRYVASGVCIVYIVIGTILPLGLLLVGSFMKLFGFFAIDDPFTTEQWTRVLHDPAFLNALRNSVVVSFGVAACGVLVYALIAYAIARTRLPGMRLLSLLVWLPWSVPGILLGMSFLWLILNLPGLGFLYGGLGALILVLVIQAMPLGTQMLRTSFTQIGDELEHASAICGARWPTTFRRVMLPLIAPMFASIFILTFTSALRDISTTILLAGARSRTLSLLMMEFANANQLESAAVVGVLLSAMAVVVTLILRQMGLQVMAGFEKK